MSKYDALWTYIHESGKPQLTLTFDEIGQIAGVPLDHSFLKYKKELCEGADSAFCQTADWLIYELYLRASLWTSLSLALTRKPPTC